MAGQRMRAERVIPRAGEDCGNKPDAARMHEILLGATNGRAADEQAVGELLRLVPDAAMAAYQRWSFIQRAVRFLAGTTDLRQFIEIGSRSTAVRTCEIVQRVALGAALRAVVNLNEPMAVLFTGALTFIEDDQDAYGLVRTVVGTLAPGSHIVITHATGDDLLPNVARSVGELYRNAGAPLTLRTRQQIAGFLDGLDVLAPGMVNGSAWRPRWAAAEPRRTLFYAGVGRKS
jgi:hypothetical protein